MGCSPRIALALLVAAATTTPVATAAAASPVTCARSFHVDPAGSDAADGQRPETAWQTLARASSAALVPGDCLLLRGGATLPGTLTLDASDGGDAARPVVVGSFGTGVATIAAGDGAGVVVHSTGGVRIERLALRGSGAGRNRATGIDVWTDAPGTRRHAGITVTLVNAQGFGQAGLSLGGAAADGSQSGFDDVVVQDSVFAGNGHAGLLSWGPSRQAGDGYAHRRVVVRRVRAHHNLGIADRGTNSGSGIVLGAVQDALIERSVAHHNGERNGNAGGGPVGIWVYDADRAVIQHNESYANRSGTRADGGGFDLDGGVTRSKLQFNWSHDNAGPGYLLYQYAGAQPLRDNVVRFNVSQNDARQGYYGAISIGADAEGPHPTASNTLVYGNTIYVTPSATGSPAGIRVWDRARGARFYNNVVVATGGVPLASVEAGATATFAGNAWWSTEPGAWRVLTGGRAFDDSQAQRWTSLAAWSQGTGAERLGGRLAGSDVDPMLVAPGGGTAFGEASVLGRRLGAYRLQPGSPMRTAGVDLAQLGIYQGWRDFFGAAPRARAVGADAAAPPVTTTTTTTTAAPAA